MMPLKGRLVRMPVPPVRPLLRRTIKRFLRLLPSILLLLFVISLIFVTLMQIAVIHTHRRLQRGPQNSPNIAGGVALINQSLDNKITELQRNLVPILSTTTANGLSATNRVLQSSADHISNQKFVTNPKIKKTEVLRIEALLDKNLPSIEANTQVLQNLVNFGRIRQILDQFSLNPVLNVSTIIDSVSQLSRHSVLNWEQTNHSFDSFQHFVNLLPQKTKTESETNIQNKSYISSNQLNFGVKSDELLSDDPFRESNSLTPNQTDLWLKEDHPLDERAFNSSTYLLYKTYESKPICSSVPQNLYGRVRIEPNIKIDEKMSQIVRVNPDLKAGGFWEPSHCYARHRVAVIIPFRDRNQHLSILLYHLHPILKRQLLSYKIYVIEQYGTDTFNKGVLMNAGVREALKENDFHCFIFHDVDLIPEDDRNLYSCPFAPRHMSVAIDKFNYSLPYQDLVGGVLGITKSNFILVNGYSNLYWGWGGEDDDMAHRLKFHNLHIIRPPESIGRYTMIKHNHRTESPNNVRSALLRMAKRRAFRDGLGSVRYKVIFKHYERCYTHIMVEIGHIHKWHFPSPNKLVLHF